MISWCMWHEGSLILLQKMLLPQLENMAKGSCSRMVLFWLLEPLFLPAIHACPLIRIAELLEHPRVRVCGTQHIPQKNNLRIWMQLILADYVRLCPACLAIFSQKLFSSANLDPWENWHLSRSFVHHPAYERDRWDVGGLATLTGLPPLKYFLGFR